MKKLLTWISCLLLVAITASSQENNSSHHYFTFNGEGNARYKVSIQAKQAELTGICILKTDEERTIGSIFNEFGIKAFDLTYSKKNSKVKLMNIIGFLDKWYIRKIVKADMKFLFSSDEKNEKIADQHRELTCSPNGVIVLKNLKYGLNYTFSPMKEQQQEDIHETDQ